MAKTYRNLYQPISDNLLKTLLNIRDARRIAWTAPMQSYLTRKASAFPGFRWRDA
jgi:hypothetical protein